MSLQLHFQKIFLLLVIFLFLPQISKSTFHNKNLAIPSFLEKPFDQCHSNIISYYYKDHNLDFISELQQSSNFLNNPKSIILNPHNSSKRSRYLRFTQSDCTLNLIFLPDNFGPKKDQILANELTKPIFNPVVVLNSDRFILFSSTQNIQDLLSSKFILSIKYKVIVTPLHDVYQFCPYCPIPLEKIKGNEKKEEYYFPDNQKNYWGSMIKISTSDKVPQLLELERKDGKNFPKRGLYASTLKHMVAKLNFTYDLLTSTGGGSTGHQLKNGTWVGIVGDVQSQRADLGFMAAVTSTRYLVADSCAPINFAFIGFATGPPSPVYSWKAIFWPYDLYVWLYFSLTVVGATILTKILLKCLTNQNIHAFNPNSKKIWTTKSAVSLFGRSFVEQGDLDVDNSPWGLRTFLASWLLMAMVMSTAYKSKMVSFMTFPVLDIVPETLEQLVNSKYFIDFHYFGNVGSSLFETSTNPTFIAIVQKMKKEPDPWKCLKRSLLPRNSCIIFIITFEELKYRNMSDSYGNSPLTFRPYTGIMFAAGIIHSHKAALSKNFKSVVNTAMEMGLIQLWQAEDLNQILRNKNAWVKEQKKQGEDVLDLGRFNEGDGDDLKLKNLKGSFGVLGAGLFMAFMAFIWELRNRLYLCRRINKVLIP